MDPFGHERMDDVSRAVLSRVHAGRRTGERKAGNNEPDCSSTLAAHLEADRISGETLI